MLSSFLQCPRKGRLTLHDKILFSKQQSVIFSWKFLSETVKRKTENKNTRRLFSYPTPNVHSCYLATLYSYLFYCLALRRTAANAAVCESFSRSTSQTVYNGPCDGICVKNIQVTMVYLKQQQHTAHTHTLPTCDSYEIRTDDGIYQCVRSLLFLPLECDTQNFESNVAKRTRTPTHTRAHAYTYPSHAKSV